MNNENILVTDLSTQIKSDYISFAQSSNARSLASVLDGLKPVHRRVLFGALSEAPSSGRYVKSAKLVGKIMGDLHPHGDMAIYETIVRMSQPFNNNCSYFDTQGNFGSIDGTTQAAQRYTELKLNPFMEWVTLDLLKYKCVSTIKNYSGEIDIPIILPTRIPLHLLNGVPQGSIGTGYSACCPPHNLNEIITASNMALYYSIFFNSPPELSKVMEYLPGPDFPNGGYVGSPDEILKLYKTGKGVLKLRGKTEIEEGKYNSIKLIITEIPYGETNEKIILSINDKISPSVNSKTKEKIPPIIEGVKSIFDESSGEKNGILNVNIVLELEKGYNPNIILEKLYKHTSLESSLNCSFNMINEKNQVQQYNLVDILHEWAKTRVRVEELSIYNMISSKADELHNVNGIVLLLTYHDINYVINGIKQCKSNSEVVAFLMATLNCTNKQAIKISELKLTQLSNLNYNKFIERKQSLEKEIHDLEYVLSNKEAIYNRCIIKWDENKKSYELPYSKNIDTSRKTQIINLSGDIDPKSLIKDETYIITLSKGSIIRRMVNSEITTTNRNTKGNKKTIGIRKEDEILSIINCHAHDSIIAITDAGYASRFEAFTIPEKSQGLSSAGFGITTENENIICLIPFSESENSDVIISLKNGFLKRIKLNEFLGKRNKKISCFPNNSVILNSISGAVKVSDSEFNNQIILLSKQGLTTRLNISNIKATSIGSRAKCEFKLKNNDELFRMVTLNPNTDVVVLVQIDGMVKVLSADSISLNLLSYMTNILDKSNNRVEIVAMESASVNNSYSDELLLISKNNKSIRISVSDLITNRKNGISAMKLDMDDFITYASIVPAFN